MRRSFVLLVAALCCLASAQAALIRIEVTSSGPFAEGKAFGDVGAYTRITGRFYGELDPMLPANRAIVDLARAPRNARGRVEYSATGVPLGLILYLDQYPGTITSKRISPSGTPVFQINQDLQTLLQNLMRFFTPTMSNKTDTTAVMLMARIV